MVLYLSLAVSAGRKQFLNNVPFFLGWSCMIWNQRFGTISFQWRQFVDHIPNFLHKGLFFYFFFSFFLCFLLVLSFFTYCFFIYSFFCGQMGNNWIQKIPESEALSFFLREKRFFILLLFIWSLLSPPSHFLTLCLTTALSHSTLSPPVSCSFFPL